MMPTMHRLSVLFFAAMLGLLGACTRAGSQEIPFSTILEGSSASQYTQREGRVIMSITDWQALQTQLQRDIDLRPGLPNVDFSQTLIIAEFAGAKPSGGYTIKVSRIVQTEQAVVVYVTEAPPAGGQAGIAQIVYPYQIVSLPRTALPIRFSFDTSPG
jgi:hypothetical protein